ncbi:DUF1214 domain-containing protein [Sphingobium sufflavum]|uniref:DUF1214 domain-containing protein n=1 Tax=Sphingobium sufflavum TaxID=1129547 RepID=UPI001F17FDE4|nr:DUF1214 domain-containing protein [Sphingobium sufflavum]MCE7795461.1 DUF1214 domain-containing protein [Sphingobium sufflavum]
MAFGDCPDDQPLRDAWGQFCDRLRAAGDRAFKDLNPADPMQRADAFRFLTQNLGQAFDLALETKDVQHPLLHDFCNPTRKLGGDCGDFVYHQAWIDGAGAYRLHGHRGTARFFNVTVQGPRPERMANGAPPLHDPFGDVPEANIFGHQLVTQADGRFELFIGGPERGPNWLPTTPGSRKLFLRQGFDRWDEAPARMSIERLGEDGPKPLPTPERMIAAMEWAGTFVTGLMTDWPDWSFAHGGVDAANPNAFPAAITNGAEDRKRGRAATNMVWRIAPDEALIVEFAAHDGLWMFTNMGAFMNSMDYLTRPVSYTPGRTAVDSDGRIRLILTHDDPGHANWVDTQGFGQGNLTYRHMLEGAPAPITTRLVRRAALSAALPADSVTVTPAERAAQLRARQDGIRQRYGL